MLGARATRVVPALVTDWDTDPVRPQIDECVAYIVSALNRGGVATTGSCCGHGRNPGEIILADGRLLTITANPYSST